MLKVVVQRAGGYGELRLEEHPKPEPAPGQVLLDVEAAGVNYADCVVRMGLYASAKRYVGWPITPGFEVAGRVAAVGRGVEDLETGEEVMALSRFGGYATGLVVPRHQVFRRPRGFSVAEAAAFQAVALTAHFALSELANPRPGSLVLVHSAAGGVGSALVQIAKLKGCRVVGIVGAAHKIEQAKTLGADHVIDRSRGNLWHEVRRLAPEGYDVVLDATGWRTLRQSYDVLAAPGKLVIYGFASMMPRQGGRPRWGQLLWGWLRTPRFNPLQMTGTNRSVLAFNLSYLFEQGELLRRGMGELLRWADAGQLRVPTVTTFPLADVASAHRALESGQTVGKLVLTMPSSEPSGHPAGEPHRRPS